MTTPSGVLQAVAAQLRDALDPLDLDALSALLDDNVRWGGNQDTRDHDHEWIVYQALRVDGQRIVDIRGCPNRYLAATRAGVRGTLSRERGRRASRRGEHEASQTGH